MHGRTALTMFFHCDDDEFTQTESLPVRAFDQRVVDIADRGESDKDDLEAHS